MGQIVVNGAQMQCSMGTAPSSLVVVPKGQPNQAGGQFAASIMDNIPMTNIPPFLMCTTLTNPQVAAATSAAQGVLTPQPCIPVIPAPWAPGAPTVAVGGNPALTSDSKCVCQWAGQISIINPGQMTVSIG
jgi:hypothetical protein